MFSRLGGAALYYKSYYTYMFWTNSYPTSLIKIKIINQGLTIKADII